MALKTSGDLPSSGIFDLTHLWTFSCLLFSPRAIKQNFPNEIFGIAFDITVPLSLYCDNENALQGICGVSTRAVAIFHL